MSGGSALRKGLIEWIERRDLFHIAPLAQNLNVVMKVSGKGLGWEYGPDFDDPSRIVFAIAIDGSLKKKEKIEGVHGLPYAGAGYRIVAGLLPRDSEQMLVWEGQEVTAGPWTFDCHERSGKADIVIAIPGEGRVDDQIVRNMIVAEIGEVNCARYVRKIVQTPGATQPFGLFAATFAKIFPGCEYADLLSKKVAGIVRR